MINMTERVFDEYTAREFLDWLDDEEASEYIKQEVEFLGEESIIVDYFDIEKLKSSFLHHIKRYVTIKRGDKLYLHDNRTCNDIMQFRIDGNEIEIQNYVNAMCDDLNNRKVNFIGKKYKCD